MVKDCGTQDKTYPVKTEVPTVKIPKGNTDTWKNN